MGDDLNFAQKFTRTAADGLTLIAKMDNPRAAKDSAVVVDMMTTLQRGAKRLRARNIYTSAQNVLSAMHHEDDAVLTGRINTLGSLVTEYARGLEEMLLTPELASAPALTHVDKWEAARDTLNALLPAAPPSDADLLSRLMRAPVTLEAMRPDTTLAATAPAEENPLAALTDEEIFALDGDVIPFVKKQKVSRAENSVPVLPNPQPTTLPEIRQDVPKKAAAKTNLTKTTPAKANSKEDSLVVTLDSMMREVIADALSVARSVDRTISLSYDMGNQMVTEMRANELRLRLGKALSQIIRQSFTNDRVGHIDINLAGKQLHIIAGTTALRVAIDPDKAPAAKPAQKAAADTDLRDQLHALMDPASLKGSAQGTVS